LVIDHQNSGNANTGTATTTQMLSVKNKMLSDFYMQQTNKLKTPPAIWKYGRHYQALK
jgi:hypothetical protein